MVDTVYIQHARIMNLIEAYKLATKMTLLRLSEDPSYDLYIEVNKQLSSMGSNILNHVEPTEEEKSSRSIGLIAARELEQTDEEYADALSKLSYLYKHPEISEIED